MTNYKSEARGFRGTKGEVFLDLTRPLPAELRSKFDVVFNHTTLEHIYDVRTAFANLCEMSRDIVITVLPFLQPYHANYGDYWRFSPLVIKRMFEDNDVVVLYQSFNSHRASSVYIFTIASRIPKCWEENFDWSFSVVDPQGRGREPYVGCHALPNYSFRLRRSIVEAWTVARTSLWRVTKSHE